MYYPPPKTNFYYLKRSQPLFLMILNSYTDFAGL